MPVHTVPRRLVIGRYVLEREIGSGGMAAVHLGRLEGAAGFSRVVAIKRLHPQFAKDSAFAAALIDEANVAGRVSHPNVVQILDVVQHEGELLVVMELIQGETLAALLARSGEPVPPEIAVKLGVDVLSGLHAAHEARDDHGRSIELVHRDVSPQNVMVGLDGNARLIDFGVAKALGRLQHTRDGVLKGKLGYLAPEAVRSGQLDRRADVYATGVVLWELLTGRRLFAGDNDLTVLAAVLEGQAAPPSSLREEIPAALDAVVLRALAGDPYQRFQTAEQMAEALEDALAPARARQVGDWVRTTAHAALQTQAELVDEITRTLDDRPDFAPATSTIRVNPHYAPDQAPTEPHEMVIPSAALPSTLRAPEPIVQPTLVSAGSQPPPAPEMGSTLAASPRAIESDAFRTVAAVPRPSRAASWPVSSTAPPAPDPAVEDTLIEPAPEPGRRSRRTAAFVIVVALLLLGSALIMYAWRAQQHEAETSVAPELPATVSVRPELLLQPEPDHAPEVTVVSTELEPLIVVGTQPVVVRAAEPEQSIDCGSPFVLDTEGIRRWKPRCVRSSPLVRPPRQGDRIASSSRRPNRSSGVHQSATVD